MRWPARAVPKAASSDAGDAEAVVHVADGGGLVAAYEQLRACALAGDGQGWRLGLAVVYRQGLAGWMRAVDGLAPARSQPATPTTSSVSTGSTGVSVSASEPLVAVLASMALACAAAGG